ncbi:MAG: type II secretion system protein, partial [Crinalium sp.]
MQTVIYKNFKKLNQGKKKANAGFTLIELLLAASLMGIVITVSGWGLNAILLANERGKAESVVNNNLARA